MRIGAGILHYRSWPEVQSTIDGLLAQTRQPDRIVIVDHASGDGSAERIRAAYPQLEVVELPDNRGASAGYNRMMRTVLERDVDAIFAMPDDIDLAPDALERLAERLEPDPALGAVGPLVAHQRAPDRVFYAGGYIDRRTWDLEFRETPAAVAEWEGKPPQPVDFLETGAILMRDAALRDTWPMPEHFYYLYDDVDLTLRMAALGWKLECVPAAIVWQDMGPADREALVIEMPAYLAVRNRLGLIARNAPARILTRELLRVVSWLIRDAIRPRGGSRADLKPRAQGLIDFCRGRWGAPPVES